MKPFPHHYIIHRTRRILKAANNSKTRAQGMKIGLGVLLTVNLPRISQLQ
jgi:hypothetical protein